jgi:hypothetical protein
MLKVMMIKTEETNRKEKETLTVSDGYGDSDEN